MKYTLITGASSGIGYETAKEFAKNGHNLIISARRKKLLEKLKTEILEKYDVEVIIKEVDLSNLENVIKFYNEIKKYDVNVLINNAGFGDFNRVWETNTEKIMKMLHVNIEALTYLTLKYIEDNKNSDYQVINVSSIVGYRISMLSETYSATKFYVSAFSEGLDQQLRDFNLKMRVKVLAPGVTETEFFDVAFEDSKIKDNLENKYKEDIKTRSKSSNDLARYCYKLYKSDKTVGIINQQNEFELKNPIFTYSSRVSQFKEI